MRILISGGGTGGHIYPALAVGRALQARYDAELLFLGDAHGLETRIVPSSGVPFVGIQAGKLRRYLSPGTLTDLGRIPIGMGQALGVVRKFRPDAVFTSGGYVSVPAGMAARLMRAPLVMHQQDVPPNLANKLLTPLASRISVSFPDSLRYFPRERSALTGNPVREAILAVVESDPAAQKARLGLDPTLPLLLVTGGSQGARHLNQVTVEALPDLLPNCQVLHISGQLTYAETSAAAESVLATMPALRPRYVLSAYLEREMPDALSAADVVLCRSGAATLAELAVLGRPSLLIPLPPGFGGSPQAVNAEMFRQAGAAEVILDRDLTPSRLMDSLLPLLKDDAQAMAMGLAARRFGHPEATNTLADLVAALAGRKEPSLEPSHQS